MSGDRKGPPVRNRYVHVLFGVIAVIVLVFVLTRETPPRTDSPSAPAPAAVDTGGATTTPIGSDAPTPTDATSTSAARPEEVTTTTPPPQESEERMTDASAYLEALAGFKLTLQGMVVEISAANTDWDNREVTGVRFNDVEATIVDVAQRVGIFERVVRDQEVPDVLRDRHHGVGGPLRNAERLSELAPQVLDGLRLPPPDDGSVRRAALAEFIDAVDVFNSSVDDLLLYVEENASDLGLMIRASTTVATTSPGAEIVEEATAPTDTPVAGSLSAEAIAYAAGLTRFKVMVGELIETSNDANLAWDSKEAGVTYRITETALTEVLNRFVALRDAVGGQQVPGSLETRGAVVIESASGLVPPAEAMLEGLRLPAPEDGSARRAALADLKAAANDFISTVDELASYIEENVESLGLMAGG